MIRIPSLLIGRYGGPRAPGLHVQCSGSADRKIFAVKATQDVSFGVWSPRHQLLYALSEQTQGAVDVIESAPDWRRVVRVPTHGADPCHCALNSSEAFLAIANYGSGSVAVYALDHRSGLPLPDPWVYQAKGNGPDKERQEGPHAHWVGFSPDERWLLQVDLGADCIRSFPFDRLSGVTGKPRIAYLAPPGSGPRWIEWVSPKRALLIAELASTLSLLSFDEGEFHEIEHCSTRPLGRQVKNLAGHVVASRAGDRVYCSNRGDDTVAVFALDKEHLELRQTLRSGGASPRFLCLIEESNLLLVGHEETGQVQVLSTSPDSELAHTGQTIPLENVAWLQHWTP